MKRIKESVDFISSQCSEKPSIGVTLGSGLGSFVEHMDEVFCKISYAEIPHFIPPSVEGHSGALFLGKVGGNTVAVLQGRVHFYEGHSYQQVVYPARVLNKLGVNTHILTNAAGGLDPAMRPGDFMLIRDHINLTGHNPLVGPNVSELGPRFPDMTDLYSKELRELTAKAFKKNQIAFHEGVYCGVLGPSYETAAEVQYLAKIGGHAVGMSTVPEAIAIKHMQSRLLGISCITNLATGLSHETISHDDVKEIARKVESNFAKVLTQIIAEIRG